MGGLIPLGDASRRPSRIPFVTALIILVNGLVFVMELMGGDRVCECVVRDSRPDCLRPSMDYVDYLDVPARQLDRTSPAI